MTEKHHSAGSGGGIFVAIFLLLGAVIGIMAGQPSLGILGGLVAGLFVAGLQWMIGCRRKD